MITYRIIWKVEQMETLLAMLFSNPNLTSKTRSWEEIFIDDQDEVSLIRFIKLMYLYQRTSSMHCWEKDVRFATWIVLNDDELRSVWKSWIIQR